MNNTIPIFRTFKNFVARLLFVSTFLTNVCSAQNLVPNSDFESNSGCPSGWSQLNLVNQWTSPSGGTPDYYHTCATVPELDVPLNISGYAQPHSGNGYVGIITYTDTVTFTGTQMYIEYIQAQLISPMIAGQCYEVSFWVSCSEGTPALAAGDPNIFGLSSPISGYISVQPPSAPGWYSKLPIPVAPQISSMVTVDDTSQWTLVTDIYTAVGGEQYITIGNWNLAVIGNGPPNSIAMFEPSTAYYFVDDVAILPVAAPDLGADQLMCPGETITLTTAVTAATYNWSTGEITSSITVTSPGIYWVEQVTGSCVLRDTIEIILDNCSQPTPVTNDCSLYIPNCFTPNSDHRNDKFGAAGENIQEFHIMIFNRWGELLFESFDLNDHWDGTCNAQPVQQDVYVYKLDYRCNYEPKSEIGHIVLVR